MSDTSVLEPPKVSTELFDKALQAEIDRIRSLPPDHRIVQANANLLRGANGPLWGGVGTLEMVGAGWFATDCALALTDASTGVKTVVFSATGFDWAAGAFHSLVTGAFVVDPATVAGRCGYSVAAVAAAEGVVSLSLYGPNGTCYGVFAGVIEVGAVVAGVHGVGDLLCL